MLVIGGGVVGAASALAAALIGSRTALVERASLARARGSSRGTARIYAPAAYPDEAYLEMGLKAHERWREVESEGAERFILRTGALSVGGFAEHQLPLLREAGVAASLISKDEARRRFGARFAADRPVLYQGDAGVIRADRALAALLARARDAGVQLFADEAVRSIDPGEDDVVVETDHHRWRAQATIVCAGPWAADLLSTAGLDLPITVTCQSVLQLELADPGLEPVAVIDYDGQEPYALRDPARGLKAAFHARGPQVHPDRSELGPDADAAEQLTAWVDRVLPGVTKGPPGVETCLYANTPDERFILERHGRVVVAAACNGQGFQLAPETGRRLAELAVEPVGLAPR